jgi:hypothetical protein
MKKSMGKNTNSLPAASKLMPPAGGMAKKAVKAVAKKAVKAVGKKMMK